MERALIEAEEMERLEKAKKRGRAWQCLRCYYRDQKRWVDIKCRVEEHIMKVHLALEEVPFYCKLCLFRCQQREQLIHHVTAHKRHVEMAAKRKIVDHGQCLVENARPHILGPLDYVALTADESLKHFLAVQQVSQPGTPHISVSGSMSLESTRAVYENATTGRKKHVTATPEVLSAFPLTFLGQTNIPGTEETTIQMQPTANDASIGSVSLPRTDQTTLALPTSLISQNQTILPQSGAIQASLLSPITSMAPGIPSVSDQQNLASQLTALLSSIVGNQPNLWTTPRVPDQQSTLQLNDQQTSQIAIPMCAPVTTVTQETALPVIDETSVQEGMELALQKQKDETFAAMFSKDLGASQKKVGRQAEQNSMERADNEDKVGGQRKEEIADKDLLVDRTISQKATEEYVPMYIPTPRDELEENFSRKREEENRTSIPETMVRTSESDNTEEQEAVLYLSDDYMPCASPVKRSLSEIEDPLEVLKKSKNGDELHVNIKDPSRERSSFGEQKETASTGKVAELKMPLESTDDTVLSDETGTLTESSNEKENPMGRSIQEEKRKAAEVAETEPEPDMPIDLRVVKPKRVESDDMGEEAGKEERSGKDSRKVVLMEGTNDKTEEEYIPHYIPTPLSQLEHLRTDQEQELADEDNDEEEQGNILEDILSNEDRSIPSPTKRKTDFKGENGTKNKRQRKDIVEKLPVDVAELSERTLVHIVDTFRKAMEKNAEEVKKMREKVTENTVVMSKLIDVLARHKTALEVHEKGEQQREEKRLDFERRREDERRRDISRWREDERRRDEWKKDIERREREERRRAEKTETTSVQKEKQNREKEYKSKDKENASDKTPLRESKNKKSDFKGRHW